MSIYTRIINTISVVVILMEDETLIDETIKKDKTTIPCKKSTRIRIKDLGKKGESYDSLLNRIIDNNMKKEMI